MNHRIVIVGIIVTAAVGITNVSFGAATPQGDCSAAI
jgi:hypothetical protein